MNAGAPARLPNVSTTARRADRLSAILDVLSSDGVAEIASLARDLGVSAATLRRDLAVLEQQHLLVRTHGGAKASGPVSELPVGYRDRRNRAAKRSIAHEAAIRIPPEPHVVGLSGGTTTSEIATALSDRSQLTVVTNALNIALDLSLRPGIKVIVTGGVARPRSCELVGPWAEDILRRVNIGTAFVGVDGISVAGGLTTHDEIEALTNRAMIDQAQRVVVVADGSKVGRSMLARIAPVPAADELITDSGADPAEVDLLREAGLTVTTVAVDPS